MKEETEAMSEDWDADSGAANDVGRPVKAHRVKAQPGCGDASNETDARPDAMFADCWHCNGGPPRPCKACDEKAEVERLRFLMECADTPLMRDVMAERDSLRVAASILQKQNERYEADMARILAIARLPASAVVDRVSRILGIALGAAVGTGDTP